MGRAWILLLLAAASAACAGSQEGSSESSAQDIIGMGTSPAPLAPLDAESITTLGAYATPVALSDGKPTLSPRAVVYTPRWELWSDGATKRRFVVLPEGTKIGVDATSGAMTFPEGTRVFKEFYAEGHLVETRVLEKGAKGFRASTFLWTADNSDARRDTDGKTVSVGATNHVVPPQADCASCHNDGKNPVLGLSRVQLDPNIEAEVASALFDTPPTPFAWADDVDPSTQATLGYLHANCGHCHREADDTAFFQLQWHDSGQPAASLKSRTAVAENGGMMLYRITANEMPPLGVTRVDDRAANGDVADGIKKLSGQY